MNAERMMRDKERILEFASSLRISDRDKVVAAALAHEILDALLVRATARMDAGEIEDPEMVYTTALAIALKANCLANSAKEDQAI